MKTNNIIEIFKRFAENNPSPKTELDYTNIYTFLVAIVLSAQATDVGVNKATPELFSIADTPQKMIDLGEEKLKEYIKTIGLFNSKAKNIITLSKMLVEKYDGVVPDVREELEKLSGVGRKTANVLLNCAFDIPVIAVDRHVLRVSNRIGIVKTDDVLQTEVALCNVIPSEYKKNAHHWLVLHGRYVCKARKPICSECIIEDLCEHHIK